MSKTFFNIRESNTTEEVVEEVVELEELTAAEKKMINQMYDKKGNLTAIGKKVMDHGKKEAGKLSPKDLDKDAARRKEYKAFQKSKRNEEVDVKESAELAEAMGNWIVSVAKPINKLKKGDKVTVKARSTFEAINKAMKHWKDPALKAVPSSHFKIVKEEVGVEEAKKSAGKKLTPDQIRKALSSTKAKAKGKEKVSLKKAPWDK